MFCAERRRAFWVSPSSEPTTLTAASQAIIEKLWHRVEKEKLKIVEVTKIGSAILKLDLSVLGSFASNETSSVTQDLDATTDDGDAPPPKKPKAARSGPSSTFPSAPPSVGMPIKTRKSAGSVEFKEIAVHGTPQKDQRQKRKRLSPTDSAGPVETGGRESDGINFKSFKKQKFSESTAIVKVSVAIYTPALALSEAFEKETAENRTGDELFNYNSKIGKKKR